ncbi:MAG: helix-turn-helix domain-containing protein [Clostridia bacterium]
MDYRFLNPYVRFAMRIRRGASYEEPVCAYDYRLFYVLVNECRLCIGASEERLGPGDLAILPPAVGYRLYYQPEAPCTFVLLNFDPPFDVPLLGREHFALRQPMERICDLMQNAPQYGADMASAELKGALLQVVAERDAEHENALLSYIRHYLDVNFLLPLTNGIVAKRFGYHPYYLNQLFSAGTGQSIHAYLIAQRLRYAQQLLLSTERGISVIALECGFGSASWFSECFKAKVGVSPSEYRGRGK